MPDPHRLGNIGMVKPKLTLLNRDAEIEALDALLTGTSNGVGGALVLREEPGGSSLLESAIGLARASAEVLAFVARRLRTEPIAFLFAVREPGTRNYDGLPEVGTSEMDRSPGPAAYAMTIRELGLGRYQQAATAALNLYRADP